jgi:hypothetical protein
LTLRPALVGNQVIPAFVVLACHDALSISGPPEDSWPPSFDATHPVLSGRHCAVRWPPFKRAR